MVKFFVFVFLLSSCATILSPRQMFDEVNTFYTFQDVSGRYFLNKQIKIHSNKLISRSRIFSINRPDKELEKSLTVTSIKDGAEPLQGQFTIWLKKEENSSQITLDKAQKKLSVRTKEGSTIKQENYDLPTESQICFYGQLIECLYMSKNIREALKKEISLTIIWEGYPFYQELHKIGRAHV